MKKLMVLISISLTGSAYGACQAPGQSFLEDKLKESFVTGPAEKELKDIAQNPKNYALREEIKSLHRRSKFANRFDMEVIEATTNQKFSQMIESTRRSDEISDFPIAGATSKLSASTDSLAIEVNNLSKEEFDVLPPAVLDKLSNKVKIHYMFPYDKFEYVLTYDGRELPMKKAFLKMQNDFEDACEDRSRENQHSKDLHELDRKSRGLGQLPSSGSSSGSSTRGSAAQ